jgi:hypothetical protein
MPVRVPCGAHARLLLRCELIHACVRRVVLRPSGVLYKLVGCSIPGVIPSCEVHLTSINLSQDHTLIASRRCVVMQSMVFDVHELRRTMKLWIGSSGGCPAGLPGHVFGAGTGQPNWGCASSAVSVHPSLGSLHPFCEHEQPHMVSMNGIWST